MKRFILLFLILVLIPLCVFAEYYNKDSLTHIWVVCQPDSFVNIRYTPKNNSEIIGYMLPTYDGWTDGKIKNGYLHLVDLPCEFNEGWVSSGYVVYDEPEECKTDCYIDATSRVAARRSINGDRRCWVHPGDTITVYWYSDEWCVTNIGFIKTEFISFADLN